MEKRGDCAAQVTLTIKNTNSLAGAEVVQVYIHHRSPSVQKPEVELAGFKKVNLQPGESKTVSIPIDVSSPATHDGRREARLMEQHKAFSYYDVTRSCWIAEKGAYEFRVGPSSTVVSMAKGFVLEKSYRWLGQGEPIWL